MVHIFPVGDEMPNGSERRILQPWEIESTVAHLKQDMPLLAKFSPAYLTDEIGWIKDHRLTTRELYLEADRAGRGTRLSMTQREEVWKLVAAYQWHLKNDNANDWHGFALDFHRLAVEENRAGFPQYEAIFIDEAQFFAKSWFEIVRAALKPGGHLFLAADPTQGFLRRRQSWIAAGIEVRGRTTRLTRAYRNTRAILSFARDFYLSRREEGADEEGFNLPDDAMLSAVSEEGELPVILTVPTVQDELSRVVNEVLSLQDQGLMPGSLLILHADSRKVKPLQEALNHRLGRDLAHDLKDGPMPESAFCSITTLNAATGLEAPVVFLLGMDRFLESEADPRLSAEERAELRRDHTQQLYMGFTRAGQRLVVMRVGMSI